MFLSASLRLSLQNILSSLFSTDGVILQLSPVSGGDISRAYKVDTTAGPFFLKVHPGASGNALFAAEESGLRTLGAANGVVIPAVIASSGTPDEAFLLMEWVEAGNSNGRPQENLGRMLAALHRVTDTHFGFGTDNFIGKLPQSNRLDTSWASFFITQRIEPMLRLSIDKGLIDNKLLNEFKFLFNKMDALFPKEAPSLLHGDFWSGNYLTGKDGRVFMIDPAVYFGYREMDLAMTMLFGGFSAHFYAAYQESFPLQPDWRIRANLWNLYPLLVHVNLFGASYVAQVANCLRRLL